METIQLHEFVYRQVGNTNCICIYGLAPRDEFRNIVKPLLDYDLQFEEHSQRPIVISYHPMGEKPSLRELGDPSTSLYYFMPRISTSADVDLTANFAYHIFASRLNDFELGLFAQRHKIYDLKRFSSIYHNCIMHGKMLVYVGGYYGLENEFCWLDPSKEILISLKPASSMKEDSRPDVSIDFLPALP